MFRQTSSSSISLSTLLRQKFLEVNSQLDNIQYLDLIKALQKLQCFNQNYHQQMTSQSIRNLTALWDRVSFNDQVVVTLGDLTNVILGGDKGEYDWVFENVKIERKDFRGKSEKNGRSVIRSRDGSVKRETGDENKENIDCNFGNVYVRKRVDKICNQFKGKVKRKEVGELGIRKFSLNFNEN